MTRRVLAQSQPSGTSAVSIFTPPQQGPYKIDLILITNISGSAVDVTVYHDPDGTTYDATTCILATTSLASGQTIDFSPGDGLGIADYRATGNLAVKVSSGTTAAFTVYGEVERERL